MLERIFNHFLQVKKVSTDTRNIPAESIFFALKGDKFNGNEFALKALESGASMVVVDEEIKSNDNRIVRVHNVLDVLQSVSGMYRDTLRIPFLAITGSNGKTTTKELIRDVLKKKFKVSATLGNLNNHIGVPLTILSIPSDCEFAIIEMGANHQREIASYCDFANPDFGLITNIGKAHLEGFGGEEGVLLGKKELYDYLDMTGGKIFVNTELEKLARASEGMTRIEYGFHTGGLELTCISESPAITYTSTLNGSASEHETKLAGSYNLYNIASAIIVGRYFGVSEKDIHSAICEYAPDNNRSQLKSTSKNTLILDAYNANPSSLEYALIGLSKQSQQNRFFVIGDMLELGESGPAEHSHILKVAGSLGLKGITVGPIFKSVQEDFPSFTSNVEAKEYLTQLGITDHIILVKGSRGIRLEELVDAL